MTIIKRKLTKFVNTLPVLWCFAVTLVVSKFQTSLHIVCDVKTTDYIASTLLSPMSSLSLSLTFLLANVQLGSLSDDGGNDDANYCNCTHSGRFL